MLKLKYNHRLMCGDSTSEENVNRLMGGEKADMVFTDPPYSQKTTGGSKTRIGGELKKQANDIKHLCSFNPEKFLGILSYLFFKNKLNAYIFCNKDLVLDYLVYAKNKKAQSNILIWKKESGMPLGASHTPDIEYLITIRKSGIFNRVKNANYSKVMEVNRVKEGLHPTMKPVELISNQLLIGSKELVCDPFLGSGSTLIACEKTSRRCFGMEIDPHYCSVIIERYLKFTERSDVYLLDVDGKTPIHVDEVKNLRCGNLQ